MSDSYSGTTYDDLAVNTPLDTDFVGMAAPAIRQIKGFIKNETLNGFKDTILRWVYEAIFPVNSYYITEGNEDPNERFIGRWEKIKDRFLLGSGDSHSVGDPDGGEETHQLTVDEMPKHKHQILFGRDHWNSGGADSGVNRDGWDTDDSDHMAETGGDQPHNNMPPYHVVNIWKRYE